MQVNKEYYGVQVFTIKGEKQLVQSELLGKFDLNTFQAQLYIADGTGLYW